MNWRKCRESRGDQFLTSWGSGHGRKSSPKPAREAGQEDGRRSAGSRLPPGRLEEWRWRRGGQRKPVRRRLDWRRRAGDAETARRVSALAKSEAERLASLTDFFYIYACW
jgi:hypothetical protein